MVLNQEAVYRPCAPVETLEQRRQRGERFAIRTNLPERESDTVFGIVDSKNLAGSALPLERVRVGPAEFRKLLHREHVRAVHDVRRPSALTIASRLQGRLQRGGRSAWGSYGALGFVIQEQCKLHVSALV